MLVGGIASFQLGASIAKSLFPVFGATGMVGLRIGLSCLLLLGLWRPWRRHLSRDALVAIVPYGLSLGIMNLLFYLSLARLPLGAAVAVEFTGPLALAFLGSRRLLDLLWAALVVAGLALLLDPMAALHGVDPVGVMFAFGAGLFWALYIVFGQRVSRAATGPHVTALGLTVAAIAIVPFCLPAMAPALHDPRHLSEAAAVAVLSSALPYSLEMAAMRHVSTRSFGILMSLDPALAALFGLLFLGEHLAPLRWLAILCIVAASAGSALCGEPRAKPLQA
nr:EamA family transporter [uncultured Lichenicoccus sp.]